MLHSSKKSCEKAEKRKPVSAVLWGEKKKKKEERRQKVGKAFRLLPDRRVTRAAAVRGGERLPILLSAEERLSLVGNGRQTGDQLLVVL